MKKYLIVGLGNIGEEYIETRHNIGFKVLEHLAKGKNITFEVENLAHTTRFNHKGRRFILIKPTTFMNLSGKAVRYWLDKENIPIENLLVITDDIHLPFGKIRIKKKGSDGGHNGLKDIQQKLNTMSYVRFRFGIGGDFSKGRQVDYVLSEWTTKENDDLTPLLQRASEAVVSFVLQGAECTMTMYN